MTPERWKAAQDFWNAKARVPGDITPGDQDALAARDTDLLLEALPRCFIESADVLDLGCGEGRLSEELADRCHSYVGCDLGCVAVERARSRHPALRFIHLAGLATFAREAPKVGLVVSWTVFMHFNPEDAGWWLRQVREKLKTGGYASIQLSLLRHDPENYVDAVSDGDFWTGRWWPPEQFEALARSAGFRVVARTNAEFDIWLIKK